MKSRTFDGRFGLFIIPLAALVVYMVTSAGPAYATFPGTNGRIAFTRQITTDIAGVFTAKPDGSDEQQVPLGGTDGVEIFSDVHWSPDGRELLIGHTLRIDPSTGQCCLPFRPAIVKPDGSDYKVLTMPYAPFDGGCSVWSLDQTRLLCGFGGDHPGIFSVRSSDGGDPVRLTTYPYGGTDARDVPTDISPDGTRFVFLRYRPGPSHGGPFPFITEQVALFVENIDGTGLRQLTPYGRRRTAHRSSRSHMIYGCSSSVLTAPDSLRSSSRPAPSSIPPSSPTGHQMGRGSFSACSSTVKRKSTQQIPTALTWSRSRTHRRRREASLTRMVPTGGHTPLRHKHARSEAFRNPEHWRIDITFPASQRHGISCCGYAAVSFTATQMRRLYSPDSTND